jgi:methionine sulfoxide reductase heme-binding subunit
MTTWIVLRAAGIGAYLMLFLSVAWGLVATTSLVTKRVAKPTSTLFHQFVATVGLVLLGVHLGGLLIDAFMPFGVPDLLVPMSSDFRPVATGFGVVAMYLMVAVMVSSWLKKRIGIAWWRRLHLLAIPTFTLSMIHGIFAGTDTSRPWMWAIYLATGAVTLFLVIVRGLTVGYRPQRAPRPEHAKVGPATEPAQPASI